MRETVDSNGRVRPTDGAGPGSRAAGLDVSTRRIGVPRPFDRRHASRIELLATAPASNDFGADAIMARHRCLVTTMTSMRCCRIRSGHLQGRVDLPDENEL